MKSEPCEANRTIVQCANFKSEFTLLDHQLIHLRQDRAITQKQTINEAWGNIWSFAIADIPPGLVAMRSGKTSVPVQGKVGIFLPPFATVEWTLCPGTIAYNVLFSTQRPSHGLQLPEHAVFFPYQSQKIPDSAGEVLAIVAGATGSKVIERGINPHPLAAKLKGLIAATFEQELPLGDLAMQLGTSPAFLARRFKESFGMQPVAYRSQLRVHESMRILLSEPGSITQAGYKGGFQDLSRFNKQFRKHLGATPSDYKIDFSTQKN